MAKNILINVLLLSIISSSCSINKNVHKGYYSSYYDWNSFVELHLKTDNTFKYHHQIQFWGHNYSHHYKTHSGTWTVKRNYLILVDSLSKKQITFKIKDSVLVLKTYDIFLNAIIFKGAKGCEMVTDSLSK